MNTVLERTTIYKEHLTLLPGVPHIKKIPALKFEHTDFIFLADDDVPAAKLIASGSYSHSDMCIHTECVFKLSVGEFDFKTLQKSPPYSVITALELRANVLIKGFLCAVVKVPRQQKPYLM